MIQQRELTDEEIWKEKRRDLAMKFSKAFVEKTKYHAIANDIFHALLHGNNPYDLIEQLVDITIAQSDEIVKRALTHTPSQ